MMRSEGCRCADTVCCCRLLPLLLIGVSVTLSGFASVWTEKLLKEPVEGETLAQQCIQLYILGLPLVSV